MNKRKSIPLSLPDPNNIAGVVVIHTVFEGDEVLPVPNPALGKWFRDRDGYFYWGGGLRIMEDPVNDQDVDVLNDNKIALDKVAITPFIKNKVKQVVTAFETGSKEGKYGALVTMKDHLDSATGTRSVQITYGQSQTTEYSQLKELVSDYIRNEGIYSSVLAPYVPRIGKNPSLADDKTFCDTLRKAGKEDPIMKRCQDAFFESKYFQPAYNWFSTNGFRLPLSLLVIYDSYIHSGGILQFLRKRFNEPLPLHGGKEMDWTTQYLNVRHQWLTHHSVDVIRNSSYRTACLLQQVTNNNWDLSKPINANGVLIP